MKKNRVVVSKNIRLAAIACGDAQMAATAKDLELLEFKPSNYLLTKLAKFKIKADARSNYYFPPLAEGEVRSTDQMLDMFANEITARGLQMGTAGYETGSPLVGVFYSGECVGFFDVLQGNGFITTDLDLRTANGARLCIVDGKGAYVSFDNTYYDYELLQRTLNLHDKLLAKNVDIQMRAVRAESETMLGGLLNTLKTNFSADMDLSVFTPKFRLMFKKYMQDLDEAMAALIARN